MSRSIQQDINELGEKSGTIRFGQHLAEFKDPDSNAVRRLQTSVNNRQWNDLLSSKPGPSSSSSSSPSPSVSGHSKVSPFVPSSSKGSDSSSLVGGDQSGVLIDEWDFGEEESSTSPKGTNSTGDSLGPTNEVIDSVQLIIVMHEKWLPMLELLISAVSELDYSLRKRILVHEKTKQFLAGYREIVEVSERIMAGRYRRTRPENRQKADREARQLERVWQDLRPKYRRVVGGVDDLPLLNSKVTFSSKLGSGNHCRVCGLLKTELINSGVTAKRPAWINSMGHKTCNNWYNNLRLS
ncbi:hypothetical protein TRVA0_035S00672 [Trichomonascus vanleenenianus]|uniref:uncharacterized protein n=1 Tax=Trichomonascus vanleenenianus TaxID=2268995 RepID=UPI003EC9612A